MGIPKARVRYDRPDEVQGKTYKIRTLTPAGKEVSFYITINNDVVDDKVRPVEVIINSKEIGSYLGLDLAARQLSKILQQPGAFPVYVLKDWLTSYDATGGYFVPGGRGLHVSSVAAHIGTVIQKHCQDLGLL
jgi:hypothetical protein